jgi:hypothetical protein
MKKENNLDYWNSLTIQQKEKHLRQREKELEIEEGSTLLIQPYFERPSDIEYLVYSIFPSGDGTVTLYQVVKE